MAHCEENIKKLKIFDKQKPFGPEMVKCSCAHYVRKNICS